MPDVAARIRSLREQKGLSRKAFADAIGVSEAKVQAIEIGRQRIDHEVLRALSKRLGIDANWLLLGVAEANSPDTSTPLAQFVPITCFTVGASTGRGSVAQDETGSGTYAYNKAFLDRRGLKPGNLAVISVRGDSMAPDLRNGDLILIDRADATPDAIREGRIYVVKFDGDLYVKRIQRAPGKRLILVSSNPAYQPVTVEEGDMDGIKIIGRVVNSTHEW
ncbi:MAG: LexA family transcriptional regulator [Paracoccus sp. (in: a-proteobacteria)]|uniref:XRE family transcriptional regulator n=1 Tax=Paracoccus sp. TaxID=267 RepID=UPI0026E052ED|nr:LexA family transcriptional regulator [Paracoccus sp. (in: a-proteobacteria)]MDO5621239.1 LexA family transcriptional regulator [Paracoccus sp. (in: a-proteobacteria)]